MNRYREMLFFQFEKRGFRRQDLFRDIYIYDTRGTIQERVVNLQIIYYSTRFVEFFERTIILYSVYIYI